MTSASTRAEGLRERKKRETLLRIAETGLKLFVKNGYEGTTLDEIAAAAGISRRTFFYYFKSKEAILLAYLDGGFAKAIRPILLAQPTDQTPLRAARSSIIQLMSGHDTQEAIIVANLLGSTEALRARMPGAFVEMEQAVYNCLRELWPNPAQEASHRIVAMASIGAMRIAKEAWRKDGGKRPLSKYLTESFDAVEKMI
ncbi:MAG: helix-turn-helix domain containing protein [Capsulimonadaceae bacterium]|nr:helix-turn-helix domain containing protein [Capsulimonadaceae bacterium]